MHKVAIATTNSYELSAVGASIDNLTSMLGYDFASVIKPGMSVFIKPNWVASKWRESCPHKDNLYGVITHSSVIEAVADKVAYALDGDGEIIIGDNPSIDADFEELMKFTGIRRLESKYDVPCKIVDLRPLVCKNLQDYGIKSKMVPRIGDERGEVLINLGEESMLFNMDSSLFRGVFNEREETVAAHTGNTHLYSFSRSLYEADVYISIPKLKTHHKVGVTLNLKGLVGCISNKNQLVHWRIGSPETGGDEYPNKESLAASKNAKITYRGAHPGNDTIWRMVVDLYNAMLKRKRKYFSIVDGIIAGEGTGPFCPTSKSANVLLGGENLLAVDIVATRLMGFEPYRIRYLQNFLESNISKKDISVIYNGNAIGNFFTLKSSYLDFKMPEQWLEIKIDTA